MAKVRKQTTRLESIPENGPDGPICGMTAGCFKFKLKEPQEGEAARKIIKALNAIGSRNPNAPLLLSCWLQEHKIGHRIRFSWDPKQGAICNIKSALSAGKLHELASVATRACEAMGYTSAERMMRRAGN